MIALPGIAIQDKIYESSNSLMYRGIRDDGVAIIVKMLKLDYPSSQELTRYRQEYKITRSLNLEGVPPDEINTTIPKPVSDIILKLMAKNAEERYQSAWGIKADLEICADQLKEIGQISSIQLALQDASSQFQIPQKLYGRDKEVAKP